MILERCLQILWRTESRINSNISEKYNKNTNKIRKYLRQKKMFVNISYIRLS